MNDLERLVAIEAIKALKARYIRYADDKSGELPPPRLFTDDATLEFPERGLPPQSVAETQKWTSPFLEGVVSVHHCHLPEIEILSSTTARAVWPMEDRLNWSGPRASGELVSMHGFGHYHETYERVDGEWLIKTCKLTRIKLHTEYAP